MSRTETRDRRRPTTVAEERPLVHLVAALARNGVIGVSGRMPWHLPEDLRHFRALTLGHAVVMGRKTWDSIGKALSGRHNIVISRTVTNFPGANCAASLAEAIAAAGKCDEVFVIGGAEIYREAIGRAVRMTLTELGIECDGDARFPEFDRREWKELSRSGHRSANGLQYDIVRYERCFPRATS